MNLKIGFDFDGCICDIVPSMAEKVSKKLNCKVAREDFTKYYINKAFPEISVEDSIKIIYEVMEEVDHYPVKGSIEFFKNFYLPTFGNKIKLITHRKTEYFTGIEKFIYKHLKNFSVDIYNAKNKGELASSLGITHFVDDKATTIIDLANNGIVPIMLVNPWNKDFFSNRSLIYYIAVRAETWKDIEIYLKGVLNVEKV